MAGKGLRLPKACEHCRQTKKKCRPPLPCQSCTRLGLNCVVRSKARPLRTPRLATSPLRSLLEGRDANPSLPADSVRSAHSAASSHSPATEGTRPASRFKSQDPFDVIRLLVIREASQRQYATSLCELPEPQSTSCSNMVGLRPLGQTSVLSSVADLTLLDILQMLDAAGETRGLPIDLLDLYQLRQAATELFNHSPHHSHLGYIDLRSASVPLDQLSLLFAALALHNFPNPNSHIFEAFFELSTMLMDNYAGEPTLDVVSALYLQHTCVLRTGTGTRGQALIAHAVKAAHDLGIHHSFQDGNLQSLRVYLMIYFADQYSALTHSTAPCIKTTDIAPGLFTPLLMKFPRLNRLVQYVSLNGQVLESLHTRPYTYNNVIDLESIMGRICARIGKPRSGEVQNGETFEYQYEVLVQIHVFWSRIMLRAPLLLSEEHWISSLSVCLRAAQNVLSIYFDIYRPVITLMATTTLQSFDDALGRQLQSTIVLPPTWRQVRRISTSVFITVYGYWKGEASYEETARSAAMAVALLEFQRTRWRGKVQPAISTVRDLVTSSGLHIGPFMQELVPEATDAYLRIMSEGASGDEEHGNYLTPREQIPTKSNYEQLDPALATTWWEQNDLHSIFNTVPNFDFSNFGLWDEPIRDAEGTDFGS